MESRIRFSKAFTKHMSFLALVTGLIIAVSMPATYFFVSFFEQRGDTQDISRFLSAQMREIIKQDPVNWRFNVQKYSRVFDSFQQKGISLIAVYDLASKVVVSEKISETSALEIKERTAISYNNEVYGFVEVYKDTRSLLSFSTLLLILFSSIGSLVGLILYRYPAWMVRKSEEQVAEAFEKLNHLSYHDTLTGLPNRAQLNDRLSKEIKKAIRSRERVAVLFLDLDRFKLINDTLGHNCGDLLLQEVAKRLLGCIREGDTVARLGGDEFIVLLPDITEGNDVAMVANRIIEALNIPFALNGHELVITTSIGVSIYPFDGDNIEELLRHADTAMYRAKEQGKNICRFYSPSMNQAAMERLTLENGLRKAIMRGELSLYYQPIINLFSGEVIGMEALMRWEHPQLGTVCPSRFIPVAEETGLIVPLGEWAIREACRQNKQWQKDGFKPIYVSVNLSSLQFLQPDLSGSIVRALKEAELDPQYLQLEITESAAINNEQRVVAVLQRLCKQGIGIAVDDFGTGYASLSNLRKLPISAVKIDKSFIYNLAVDSFNASITQAVITMANSLGLTIIAEGVENEEQLAFLLGAGCHAIQGYVFCEPLPAKDITPMLKDKVSLIGAR